MPPGVIYDAGQDVGGWFPMEFRKYILEEDLLCSSKPGIQVFWVFQKKHQPCADDEVTYAYRRLAYKISDFLDYMHYIPPKCLVQFWRAEEVANSANDFGERRFQLTTRNQPFLLAAHFLWEKQIRERLCLYRTKTRDVIITGDGKGGSISRVFKNKRMEATPNVAYYSYEEYPQRDTTLSCLINSSLIVPLSDSYGSTFGVIEFVSQSDWPLYFMEGFLWALKDSDLMYLDPCKGLCGQYDLDKDSLRIAVSEIKEVIEVLCETFDIVFAWTWMLCKHCSSLSTSERCATELCASYQRFDKDKYLESESWCILREGEGVVGRAAMSFHNLVYCENVSKFGITEYPLAHFVRNFNLSASFVICLQSNLSGDQLYALEFFLGSSYGNWGLRKKLVPILDKMRQSFRTFKVAYRGEDIGDDLYVHVVDASYPDKVETLKNESIDLTLAIGVKNVEAFNLPYYLPQSISESSRNETNDSMIGVETSFQDISMDYVPVASASTVQSEIHVTIKANYRGDFVRFQLSASSGIHELNRQVSQRLELMEGTYELSYPDEDNDPISLTCDEDLQLYISNSTKEGNFVLMVSIEPKRASPM